MTALPSAFAFQVSRAARRLFARFGVAKSIIGGRAAVAAAMVPVSKSVGRGDVAGRHVEVGVRVDAARHDVQPRCVEHRVGPRRQALADARDDAVLDVDVGSDAP